MEPADHSRRVNELYLQVVDLDDGARRAFLDEACADQPKLRERVEHLLGYQSDPRSPGRAIDAFLAVPPPPGPPAMPESIGDYSVLGVLGRGGMGVVYEARQRTPNRRVAIKMLQAWPHDTVARRRFELEAELLGRLRHPNIAQVFEARTDAAAETSYIAMELVDGRPLSEYVADAGLSQRQRLELWATLCETLQYAHGQGVVHRDLKPANILVDADGRPKVLDFGIARFTDDAGAAPQTMAGQVLGTLGYMSPEQAIGDPDAIDTRSDVYSLGVIGFELLTGSLPHDLSGLTLPDAILALREVPVRRPAAVAPGMAGELETILLTALAATKERRYQTADALAADIRRFLRNEPIAAHPPSAWYLLRTFARRNRGALASATAMLVLLIAGLVATILYATRADRIAGRLQEANLRERAATAHQTELARAAQVSSYAAQMRALAAALDAGRSGEARRLLEAAPEALRGWEWDHFAARLDTCEVCWGADSSLAAGVGTWRAGSEWVTVSTAGEVLARDVETRAISFQASLGAAVTAFSVAAERDQLATLDAGGTITLWRLDRDRAGAPPEVLAQHAVLGGDGGRTAMQLSPTGDRVVVKQGGRVSLWIPARNQFEALAEASDHVAWSMDGSRISVGPMWILDGESGHRLAHLPEDTGALTAAAFSVDGGRVAYGTRNPIVYVMDVASRGRVAIFHGHQSAISAMAWHPSGEWVVTGDRDGDIQIWDAATGALHRTLLGHTEAIDHLVFDSDGDELAAAAGGSVRVWDLTNASDIPTRGDHDEAVHSVAFSPEGDLVVSADRLGEVRVWDGWDLACLGAVQCEVRGGPRGLGWLRDGEHVVLTTPQRYSIDLLTGAMTRPRPAIRDELVWPGRTAYGRSVSAHGELSLRAPRRGGQVELRRGEQTEPFATVPAGSLLLASCFSPDDRLVALAWGAGSVTVHDTANLALVATLVGHSGMVHCVAFSAHGRRLASGGEDRTIRLWDTGNWSCTALLHGHDGDIQSLSFSSDGSRLVSGSHDGTVRMWGRWPRRQLVSRADAARQERRHLAESLPDEASRTALWREERNVHARRLVVQATLDRGTSAPEPADQPRAVGAAGSSFGSALAVVPARGGQGPRIAIGAPTAGSERRGSVSLWAPDLLAAQHTAEGATDGELFGSALAVVDDLDGDGVADLAVGSPGADGPGGLGCGAVTVVSGRDLERILRWHGPAADEHCGHFVAIGSDYDGDGRRELLVAGRGDPTVVRALSLATSEVVQEWVLRGAGQPPVVACADLDGDGVDDLGLVDSDRGVRLVSGAEGRLIHEYPRALTGVRGTLGALLGADRDGDGLPELVWAEQGASLRGTRGLRNDRRVAQVAADPDVLGWRADVAPTRSSEFPRLRAAADYNRDGVGDVLVWTSNRRRRRAQPDPLFTVLDGANGGVLAEVPTPADARAGYGSASWLGDLDGDDRPELIIGAPDNEPPRVEIQSLPALGRRER